MHLPPLLWNHAFIIFLCKLLKPCFMVSCLIVAMIRLSQLLFKVAFWWLLVWKIPIVQIHSNDKQSEFFASNSQLGFFYCRSRKNTKVSFSAFWKKILSVGAQERDMRRGEGWVGADKGEQTSNAAAVNKQLPTKRSRAAAAQRLLLSAANCRPARSCLGLNYVICTTMLQFRIWCLLCIFVFCKSRLSRHYYVISACKEEYGVWHFKLCPLFKGH